MSGPAVHVEEQAGAGLRFAHLSVPKPGEHANGDRAVVRRDGEGRTLLGVIDALGHGPGAEEVALAALDELRGVPLDASIEAVFRRLHERLRGTRGAAATLCFVRGGHVEACGVGNVELRCNETELPFVLSPGSSGCGSRGSELVARRSRPARASSSFRTESLPSAASRTSARSLPRRPAAPSFAA